MNITDISGYSPDVQTIHINDVLENLAVQIDHKIYLCLLLFSVAYIFRLIVLGRGRLGLLSIGGQYKDTIDLMIKNIDSFLETIFLGCAGFVLYVCWVQDYFGSKAKFIVWTLLVLVVLVGVVELIGWLRSKLGSY